MIVLKKHHGTMSQHIYSFYQNIWEKKKTQESFFFFNKTINKGLNVLN